MVDDELVPVAIGELDVQEFMCVEALQASSCICKHVASVRVEIPASSASGRGCQRWCSCSHVEHRDAVVHI